MPSENCRFSGVFMLVLRRLMLGGVVPPPDSTMRRSESGSVVPGFVNSYVRHPADCFSKNAMNVVIRSYMMPAPPRRKVRWLANTSHEKATRGPMLFRSFLRWPVFKKFWSRGMAWSCGSLAQGTVKPLSSVLISSVVAETQCGGDPVTLERAEQRGVRRRPLRRGLAGFS